jgi:hypothetical protein
MDIPRRTWNLTCCISIFNLSQALGANSLSVASRSVTTLTETLMAQVPQKQKELAALKKEHGKKV